MGKYQQLKGKNFILEVSDDSDKAIISGIALTSFDDEDEKLNVSEKTINDYPLTKGGNIISGFSSYPGFSPECVMGEVTERKITKEGYWINGVLDKQQEFVEKLISDLHLRQCQWFIKELIVNNYRMGVEGIAMRDPLDTRKIIKFIILNICILSEN